MKIIWDFVREYKFSRKRCLFLCFNLDVIVFFWVRIRLNLLVLFILGVNKEYLVS